MQIETTALACQANGIVNSGCTFKIASIVVDTAHIVVDYRHVTLYNCYESARGQYYIVRLKFQCFKAFTTSSANVGQTMLGLTDWTALWYETAKASEHF